MGLAINKEKKSDQGEKEQAANFFLRERRIAKREGKKRKEKREGKGKERKKKTKFVFPFSFFVFLVSPFW